MNDIIRKKQPSPIRTPQIANQPKRVAPISVEPEKQPIHASLPPLPDAKLHAAEQSQKPDLSPLTRKKRRKGWKITIASLLALLTFLFVAGYVWYSNELSAVDVKNTQQVVVTLPKGSTASSVGATLKEHNLIKNKRAFELYIRLTGAAGKLQAGVYRISRSSDVPTIVSKLTTGKTDTFTITFLPGNTLAKHRKALIDSGYSVAEVDHALAKTYQHPLLASKPADADLEGYIYGETYQMPADATAEQVIERTFDEFYKVVRANDLVNKYKQRNFTLHQGIILASIVQREIGGHENDEAMVAGVFYNRLAKGMNLGSDVTYQYIADKTGVLRDPALQSDYNTRIHPGLTPGPIASPGKGALLAVANPKSHEYLFFLSGDDDVTYFGVTDADHERNIKEHCQKKCQIL